MIESGSRGEGVVRQSLGIASLTIDVAYEGKLSLCEEWDRFFGFEELDVRSAVRALKICYAARRPFFEITDVVCMVCLSYVPKTD